MKLVVRVQYIGDRARMLLREDLAPEYTKGLIDDLTFFGFPVPHEQKPIEKSGFMLCVYYVDRDSDGHRIIQNAFQKAKAEAAFLVDRSIRYISLNEDGVMHTTNLSQKPYKPKIYNKPEFQNSNPQPGSSYLAPAPIYSKPQPYGKAPRYPTTIAQARHAVSPIGYKMPADIAGPSGHHTLEYGDYEMKHVPRSPPAGSDEDMGGVDTTQHTLMQLSQSTAFQSLLQKATPTSPIQPVPVKPEPTSPADMSMLLRQPLSNPTPQPQIPNLQALLEKAGVRSTTAHAFLQNQPPPQSQYHPASSNMGFGPTPSTVAASHAPPPQPTVAAPSQITVPSNMANTSATVGASVPRPATTTPRVPTLRELWDIRREITALQARGRNVAADLRAAGQQIPLGPEDATPPSMTGGGTPSSGADLLKMRELEADIVALRQQLARETESRKLADATLRAERALRSDVEDVKREMRQPFVVPALYDAFMKIGQMSNDGYQDGPQAGGSSMNMDM
ncbi:hypothetical protein VTO73DRAFT_7116 [Trametes versicolor]